VRIDAKNVAALARGVSLLGAGRGGDRVTAAAMRQRQVTACRTVILADG
jgi:DUF917 family protein